jgi:S-(hydroxymethyl)glutathione dehydrogenase/alcohol dehydrogenase
MQAVTYQGMKDVKVMQVADPRIEQPEDIVVRITASAICGSDLHLIHNMIPNLRQGYIIGHEPWGSSKRSGLM